MGSGILGIGITGLQAYQQSLNTVSQNIANAQTPGYSRQSTTLQARQPQFSGSGFIGQGVKVNTTHRIIDEFLSTGLRESMSNFGFHTKFLDLANRIDIMVADPESGVSQGLNGFFESLHVAGYQPNSIPAREAVISQSQVLTNRIKSLDQQFIREAQTVNNNIKENINLINAYAKQIATLNTDIVAALGMSNNLPPNDLLDQRDEVIKDLSKVVSVTVTSQDDGANNIFIGNGLSLVIGGQYTDLGTQVNFNDATVVDIVLKSKGGDQVVTDKIQGGELGGAKEFLNTLLFPARNSLGRFAISLSMTINSQHKLGIDLDNMVGQDVFTDMNRSDISSKRVIDNQLNTGNGALSVDINQISRDIDLPVVIASSGQLLTDSGTLTGINLLGDLSINNVNIRSTAPGDDTVSPLTDAANSAISIAKAINETTIQHHVAAKVEPTAVFLGKFTSGAIASSEFQINGINIVTTGTNETTLIQDINALKLQTGVIARKTLDNNIILTAYDGRNIELTSNTNTPTATFTFFDIASSTALSKVQRAQIKLTSDLDTVTIGGFFPQNSDFPAGVYPENETFLTTSDYDLSYDGANYTLLRKNDNTIVFTGADINNVKVDGFTLRLNSGTVNAGDKFTVRPTFSAASEFQMNIFNSRKFAFASPVRLDSELTNVGSGMISFDRITNISGTPVSTATTYGNGFSTSKTLAPPLRIEFVTDTSYRVFDVSKGVPGKQIGPDQTFEPNTIQSVLPICSVADTNITSAKPNYIFDPGYRINISGTPKANDVFTVNFNTDATADNTNLIELTKLQTEKLLVGKGATFNNVFSQMVSDIGVQTASSKMNLNASESLLQQSEDRRSAISGVNLDEEAANVLKLQQSYQASAQVVNVAKELFDVLMNTFRG